ncbi:hypothetical protein AB0O07_34445 [Streptomyces sp. NPDC093085]|uniref:hypothetical protein n=1 Tax=Streptomyces sp. NPDC093085 TaxID=3155068 RepID=UPI003436A8D5
MHKFVRTGAAAAGLAVALTLTLTGCGSSGDDSDNSTGKPAPTPTDSAPASAGSDSGADAASVEGTWAGVTDGKSVAVAVASGQVAVVAGEHVCQGTIEDMGKPMFSVKCGDGDTERTMGSIESNDGKTLVISWSGGTKDTLKKTAAGLPTNLPTNFPTSLPTDLPTG